METNAKRNFCNASQHCLMHKRPMTLDGEPAVITGSSRPFAIVLRADGKGGDVEYSWPAVARIVAKGGHFIS